MGWGRSSLGLSERPRHRPRHAGAADRTALAGFSRSKSTPRTSRWHGIVGGQYAVSMTVPLRAHNGRLQEPMPSAPSQRLHAHLFRGSTAAFWHSCQCQSGVRPLRPDWDRNRGRARERRRRKPRWRPKKNAVPLRGRGHFVVVFVHRDFERGAPGPSCHVRYWHVYRERFKERQVQAPR